MKAAWRTANRRARIAVAEGLAPHDLQTAGELLLPLLDEVHASRRSPRGASALLARFAELMPVEAVIGYVDERRFQELREAGIVQADTGGSETWQPESVLVHALLRIGAGEDPGRQVDWLTRDLGNRSPEHFPTAALAVVHAARGDIEAAGRVTELSMEEGTRAVALTAVAGHLARVPVRPVPGTDPAQPDPFTRTIQSLAMRVTPYATADERTATRFLHSSLATAGWYHALPVLARLEPDAVLRIHRDIVVGHAGAGGGSRSD
ncbi:hypothetical protein ACIRP0_31400 [Streptomyces sp. NPDC101733]|uniref:hypothetical protein n=1 Tax=unclassified Streptomyces TaxID=2593676 RepID=UPI00380B98AA